MGKPFKLIVFDWDGTLMDSAGAIVACIQAAAVDLGLPPPPEQRARHVIGLGLGEALRFVLPELAEDRHETLADRYRHHYLSQDHELQLFDGAEDMVRDLVADGCLLAVATGKSRKGLDRALEKTGLGDCFHATRCADECFSKPHPQMLNELMDELAVPPQLTLMIGDTTHDLQMAINAGVRAVAVAHGAHDRGSLESLSPIHCAGDISELSAWLCRHAREL